MAKKKVKVEVEVKVKEVSEEPLLPLHIVLVLDKSGSMWSIKDKTVKGINDYIESVQADDIDDGAVFTFATFSTIRGEFDLKYIYDAVPVKEIKVIDKDWYNPDGGTPLYDAVGRVIGDVEAHPQTEGKRVLMMTLTDGEENESKEFTKDALAKKVKAKKKAGWTFGYLGANQDAWGAAEAMGIGAQNASGFSTAKGKVQHAYASLNLVTYDARRAHPSQVKWPGELAKDAEEDKLTTQP